VSGRLRIDLDALAANFRRFQAAAVERGAAAVVKADAYGLGAGPVAQRLSREGCTDFFVATAAEGESLRVVLPDARILVFEGARPDSVPILRRAALIPVLNHAGQLDCWREAAPGSPAAVLFDTGMHRLGFPWDTPAERFAGQPLALVMTHYACADEPGHPLNRVQNERFAAVRARFPRIPVSSGSSAAVLGCRDAGADLGRPGIGIYGGNPYADRANPMATVVTLEAQVLQVRDVPAGEAVGYGASFRTNRAMTLAVVGIGYADGVPRLLSNRGMVWVQGERRQIVGRISMDLTTVDVTGLPVAADDWVELFGGHVALDEVAAWAGTIGYEILTGLGARLERCYSGA
jgi:alanine racemase